MEVANNGNMEVVNEGDSSDSVDFFGIVHGRPKIGTVMDDADSSNSNDFFDKIYQSRVNLLRRKNVMY